MSFETSQSIKALMPALLAFQGAVEGVKRDSNNPHFKARYASLEAVIDAARPALQQFGLVFTQAPGRVIDGCIEVTTRITHAESGEWQQATMHVPLAKRDPQGAGSALTYGQRYSLMAALGLPPTDDDAETAIDRNNTRPKPQGRVEDVNAAILEALTQNAAQIGSLDELKTWKETQASAIAGMDEVSRKRANRIIIDRFVALGGQMPARQGGAR